MKRTICLVLACLMCVALFAGCANKGGDQTASDAKVLNIALDGAPNNLDVAMSSEDIASEVVYGSVFEKLTALNGENKVIYELAEDCEVSPDNTVYTYKLRQGVKFHNGEEMKADDVVASMNRWIGAADNVKTLVGDARFEKVDDYTVQIKMESGTPYLNEMIAGLGQQAVIMPASVLNNVVEGELVPQDGYIGTGPYKFSEWADDQYIKLEKNPDYTPYGTDGDYSGWGGYKHAYYDEVYFYFPGDAATVNSGVKTGEYDIASRLSVDNFGEFEGDDNYTIFGSKDQMPMLVFNKSQGVAANATVRRAVQAVINCDDVMFASTGNKDYYDLYSSYMFKDSPYWYSEAGKENYNQGDPERAKALFDEAGWTDHDVFRILVRSDYTEFVLMAQVIQEELRAIGINCEVLTLDSATHSSVRNEHPEQWDAFITSFGPKIMPNLNLYLSSSWAGWCTDERIQNDLAAIAAEDDLDVGIKLWNDLQGYMNTESVPVVTFGTYVLSGVCKSDIEGAFIKERLVWVNAHPVEA